MKKTIGKTSLPKKIYTANVYNLVSGASIFVGCFLISAVSQRQASVLMGKFLDNHKVLSTFKELYFWIDPIIE